jgi:hypothetical protein
MAKSFREMLSKNGYSTTRADNPNVIRERDDNAPREAYGSETSGETLGPTNLFQDDRGPLVPGQINLPPKVDNIRTPAVVEIPGGNTANLKKRPV